MSYIIAQGMDGLLGAQNGTHALVRMLSESVVLTVVLYINGIIMY